MGMVVGWEKKKLVLHAIINIYWVSPPSIFFFFFFNLEEEHSINREIRRAPICTTLSLSPVCKTLIRISSAVTTSQMICK